MSRTNDRFFVFCLVAILCVLCVGCQIKTESHNAVDEFDANEPYYQQRMELYSDSMMVSPVSNKDAAIQEAMKVFMQVYGIQPSDYGPCTVAFDSSDKIWLVWTQPAPQESGGIVFGGSKCVLIRSDGQVLAIWEEK